MGGRLKKNKKKKHIPITKIKKEINKTVFGFQIAYEGESPTYDKVVSKIIDDAYESISVINGWPVLIDEKVYNGHDEFREKYGDYTLVVDVWIDELKYTFCAPTLTIDEVLQVLASMSLVTP